MTVAPQPPAPFPINPLTHVRAPISTRKRSPRPRWRVAGRPHSSCTIQARAPRHFAAVVSVREMVGESAATVGRGTSCCAQSPVCRLPGRCRPSCAAHPPTQSSAARCRRQSPLRAGVCPQNRHVCWRPIFAAPAAPGRPSSRSLSPLPRPMCGGTPAPSASLAGDLAVRAVEPRVPPPPITHLLRRSWHPPRPAAHLVVGVAV